MSYGEILVELPSEKVSRIFPDWTKTTQTLSFEDQYPGFSERASKGVPASRFKEGSARALQGARSFVKGSLEEMGQDVESVWKYLFSGETREDGTNLGQTRAVLEMIQRRPTLEADIKILARKAVTDNPGLSPDKLAESVAMGLSDKHEGQPNIGYADAAFDAQFNTGRGEVDAGAFTTPTPDALPSGDLTYEDWVKRESARMRAAMNRGPAALEDHMRDFSENPRFTDDFRTLVLAEVGSFPTSMQDPTGAYDIPSILAGSESGREAGGDPLVDATEFSSVAEAEAEAEAEVEPDDEAEAEVEPDDEAEAEAESEPASSSGSTTTIVLDLSKLLDKKMSPEKATKTLADYKKEFIDEMPEYKGMSEEAKGWAIAEAGLRVAAGTSKYAMVNFAEGLKGLGDTFAKDEKEKRSWDRQVDLSAAKYALENIKSDRIKAEALAKEKRKLYEKIFVVRKGQKPFDYQGRILNPGDRVIVPVGELQDGSFPLDKFQSETSLISEIKSDNAKTRAYLGLAGKQIVTPKNVPVKRYIADSMRLRTNIATRSLLSRALVELQKPGAQGPLGVAATAKNMLLSLANSLNKKQLAESYFGSLTSQKDYDDFTNRAVTTQIEGLINEGGKITDQERKLAKEIGGALSKGAMSGIFEDRNKLERQLVEFSQALDRDSESRVRSMSLDEKNWDKHFRNLEDAEKGYSYGAILRESRPTLSSPAAPRAARIIPGSINWKDIITVGKDGKVTGFKSWATSQ